jgi:hypothetical protein
MSDSVIRTWNEPDNELRQNYICNDNESCEGPKELGIKK